MNFSLAIAASQATSQSAALESPSGFADYILVPVAQTGTGAGDIVKGKATSSPGQLAANIEDGYRLCSEPARGM